MPAAVVFILFVICLIIAIPVSIALTIAYDRIGPSGCF